MVAPGAPAQPRAALAGLAQLPCWTAPEATAATGGALPAFSAYPQARPNGPASTSVYACGRPHNHLFLVEGSTVQP